MKTAVNAVWLMLVSVAVLPSLQADLLLVDCSSGPFQTIQSAINAANPGDEIVVMPCVYHESIDFLGKAITVRSHAGAAKTTIDASGLQSAVVKCVSGETNATRLIGFTITGGTGNDGGGMFNSGSSPSVINCIFYKNHASDGGGMENQGGSNSLVINCLFYDNHAEFGLNPDGGGMRNVGSNPKIINCTFWRNSAVLSGGGIANYSSDPTITNCIVWNNTDSTGGGEQAQIFNQGSTPVVTFSCIMGCSSFCADPNNRNISADPRFVDPPTIFRLSCDSPCIDVGDSAAVPAGLFFDLAVLARLRDDPKTTDSGVHVGIVPVTVDLGPYEYYLQGDIDGDGAVGQADLGILLAYFGTLCP